jgi:hypothetical protein
MAKKAKLQPPIVPPPTALPPSTSASPSQPEEAQIESTQAHWTTADETTLLNFLQDHISEGGDGLNFKGVTWTAAAKVLEASRTKGALKNALATKNKFVNVCFSLSWLYGPY